MKSLGALWRDDAGVILSAEAVVVGTVAVVGLTAGMSVVATSVNEELKDVGMAIRSLDQSYVIPPQEGCGAKTAGSSFTQEPVEKSLRELQEVYRKAEKAEKQQAERLRDQMEKRRKDEVKEDSRSEKSREESDDDSEAKEDSDRSDADRGEKEAPRRRRTQNQI